jgi:hypothetical protein
VLRTGSRWQRPITWTFTRRRASVPLAVTTTPANGATGIGVDTVVKLVLNRSVNSSS